jgi:hypothetical protein
VLASDHPKSRRCGSEQPSHLTASQISTVRHLAISMESKRSALGAHKHHIAADADEAAAVKKVKSISVTSIFKQQAKKTKSLNAAPQINLGATSPVARDEPVRKVNTSKLLSSSRSPHKSSSRASKKRLDPHPLLVEFKGTSLQTVKLLQL